MVGTGLNQLEPAGWIDEWNRLEPFGARWNQLERVETGLERLVGCLEQAGSGWNRLTPVGTDLLDGWNRLDG